MQIRILLALLRSVLEVEVAEDNDIRDYDFDYNIYKEERLARYGY